MKYTGIPAGMWLIFSHSFEKQLCHVFDLDRKTSKTVISKAKNQYKEIIAGLPEFEKGDRFQSNIVSCAMLLCAIILSMQEKPDLDRLTVYYRGSMMIPVMK